MRDRAKAFVALGANLGEREAQIERALGLLAGPDTRVVRRSGLYLTEPVGGPPQDWYVNAVAELDTGLSAEDLLEACLGVERAMGRVRTVKDGPRTIDVDILLYGSEVRDTEGLVLPHPRLHLRRFVLVPLAEIAPTEVHPRTGLTVTEMLAGCPDHSLVRPHSKTTVR